MFYRKQVKVILALIVILVIGIAAMKHPAGEFKNLKILPKDISSTQLDSIMQSYNKALGVKCDFCHSPFVKNVPDSLDFPSEGNEMKENARKMMSMNIYINKTYFYFNKEKQPEFLNTVNCMTCHRGVAFPAEHDDRGLN